MKVETKQRFKVEKCLIVGAVCALILDASSAFAAAGGAHGGRASFADIIPYWVNFTIYVVLLTVLLRKPVADAWAARTQTIRSEVDRGRIERENAEKIVSTALARQASLKNDVATLQAQIEREASAEAQDMIREALVRADRARQQGNEMLDAEQKAFEADLKKALAEDVIRRATEKLKTTMTAEKDASLRSAALNDVTRLVH